ncbi:hypothetical protein BH10BAC3_BH10BAC3_30880 [soil metagenome]
MNALEKKELEFQALQLLQSDPLKFLRKYSVVPSVAGNAHGISEYSLALIADVFDQNYFAPKTIQRPSSFWGRKKEGYSFKIIPDGAPGSIKFPAISIVAKPSNGPINPYRLMTNGPNIMITPLLTGCCIVMIPDGLTWGVAHLQPAGGESGDFLRRRLAAAGVKVYGAPDYEPGKNRSTLIGVRQGQQWDFYAQIQDRRNLHVQGNVLSVKKLTA